MAKKSQLDKAIEALQIRQSDLKLRFETESAALDAAIRAMQAQQVRVRKPRAVPDITAKHAG